MGRVTLRDCAFSDEITQIPDPLWRQLRRLMRQRIQRERKKRGITGTDPAGGWDLIMDDNRHVVDPPKPKDVPDFISPEQFADTVDHIARAERAFEITLSTPSTENPPLDDIKHDVEAAVFGMVAWDDGNLGYAWDALNRLGHADEIDIYLRYNAVLVAAFETSGDMPDHPSPEKLVKHLVSRAEAASPILADTIRSVWGSYLIISGKRKEGEKLLAELIKKNPDDPRYCLSLAMPLEELGDRRQATKAFKSALEIAVAQDDYPIIDLVTDHLIDLGAMTAEEAEDLFDESLDIPSSGEDSEWAIDDELIEEAMDDHPEYRDFLAEHGPGAEMDGTSPMMHLVMHAVVERQLRENEFPEMKMVLAKLTSEGMSRHEAIHTLSVPLAEMMYETMTKQKPFNHDVYTRKIRKLLR